MSVDYDRNGNIKKLKRYGHKQDELIDDLEYTPYSPELGSQRKQNRLSWVNETLSATIPQRSMGLPHGQAQNNYSYDAMGNLTADEQAGITRIGWRNDGKIRSIHFDDNRSITYLYDAMGNRVQRYVTQGAGDAATTRGEFYVRDAQGNIMATYSYADRVVTLTEQPIYGSRRIGMYTPGKDLSSGTGSFTSASSVDGNRKYEIPDHRGNVLAVVSDLKTPQGDAKVIQPSDYYPFGMKMQNFVSLEDGDGYRFGFQGQEAEKEIWGGEASFFKYRLSDNRIGRFFAVDPLTKKYPHYTPYSFSGNKLIAYRELEGLEESNATNKSRLILAFGRDGYSIQQKTKLKHWDVKGMRAVINGAMYAKGKEATLDYLIIRSHGTPGKVLTTPKLSRRTLFLMSTKYNDDFKEQGRYWNAIFSMVKPDGCIIFTACTAGRDKEFVTRLAQFSKREIYLNRYYSMIKGKYSSKILEGSLTSTVPRPNDPKGWYRANVLRNDEIPSFVVEGIKDGNLIIKRGEKSDIPPVKLELIDDVILNDSKTKPIEFVKYKTN